MKLKLNAPAVRSFMNQMNWTERDLARHMGVSYTTVYRALRGQRGVGGAFVKKLLSVTDGNLSFDDTFIYDGPLPNGNNEDTA
ncbi:helix-turn-helix domain-containing protein [Alicyclobacillus kakegawensis]|uniref:helix-turn-helix domain-containing protein n=1 Tax=Alicyclobacillus kakegawensis TaxID=392012 RepID=UPI00083798B3|nr:helix-turn-helix transcriptional regulator [Alicyclobacillus kakegawensis]